MGCITLIFEGQIPAQVSERSFGIWVLVMTAPQRVWSRLCISSGGGSH